MKVLKCDVCGGIYDLERQDNRLRIVEYDTDKNRVTRAEPRYFDLCPACQQSLREFVHPETSHSATVVNGSSNRVSPSGPRE